MDCRWTRGFILASLLSLVAGCGGGSGSGGSGPNTPPDLLPAVESTFPAPLAVGVPRTAIVSAQFSEPMDAFYIAFTPSFTLESNLGSVTGTITVSPDGREVQFTSSNPFEYGTAYTAMIKSGTLSASGQELAADYTWTFTTEVEVVPPVVPPEWSTPELMDDTAEIVLNGGYDIEIDDAGNGIAVWVRTEAGVRSVIASRSEAGGSWEDPATIPDSEGSATSAVADIGGSAEILVVWAAGDQLWASRAGTSGDWTDPEPVGDVLDDMPTPRHVFMDPDGNAVVIYHVVRSGPTEDNVYAIRYDAANGEWESVVELPTSHFTDPAFAGEPSGTIVGVWYPLDNNQVIARRYTPSGGWSGDVVLDTNLNDSPVYLPFVTLDGSGNAIAVWLRRIFGSPFAGMNDMFMSRMDSSGDWSDLEMVPVGPNAGYPQFGLAALSPDGRAAITWRSSQSCWAIVQDSSLAWSAPEVVDNSAGQGQAHGFPFFSGEQVFVIGATTATAGAHWIWTNRYDPDEGWDGAELYRTSSGWLNGSTYLELECALDHAGSAAVFWKESTTAGAGGDVTMWVGRFPAP